MNFIFETISIRLKNLFNKKTRKQNADNTNDVEFKRWFLISFIPKIADKFKKIAKMIKSKIAFFSLNKLGRIIKAQKNPLPIGHNKNVYKLCCKNCNVSYVGQTKRRLNTRILEHKKENK